MKKYLTLLLLLGALEARAQVTPTTIFALTNLPSVLTTNATTNLFPPGTTPTSNIISLRQGQGMAVIAQFAGTNASATAGVTFNFSVSLDGTNYSSTPPLSLTASANGATGVIAWTNFASSTLNNLLYITPQSIANANTAGSASILLTNVTVSFGNVVPGYP